jgi:transposase-like protein
LDLAAQIAASDGAAGPRSASGPGGIGETYLGGEEEGLRGRLTERKVLLAIACEEDGKGMGRIRLRRIKDASAISLETFVAGAIEPGSVVHTDAWRGYSGLVAKGYYHQVTGLKGHPPSASELLPRVHLVASLLKRWLLGTHQGAVRPEHLDYYLDEFTFRFNRRKSRSRGKLFYRLLQQAVAVQPVPYKAVVGATWAKS